MPSSGQADHDRAHGDDLGYPAMSGQVCPGDRVFRSEIPSLQMEQLLLRKTEDLGYPVRAGYG